MARGIARAFPGVSRYDDERVADDDYRELYDRKTRIEAASFQFLVGSPALWPGQVRELEGFSRAASELDTLARRMQVEYTIEIRGHTNPTGNAEAEESAARGIAERFLDTLKGQGLTAVFTVRSMGAEQPERRAASGDAGHNRLVSFKVTLRLP